MIIKEVQSVYLEENGILAGLKDLSSQDSSSTLCLDCTTLDPKVASETASLIKGAGNGAENDMIDAPVSGGEF